MALSVIIRTLDGRTIYRDPEYHPRITTGLLTCSSITAAATRCGVAEATLHRWLKDTTFQQAYSVETYEPASSLSPCGPAGNPALLN